MASVQDILSDWASGSKDREALLGSSKPMLTRWLSQAQLRYADKSGVLRGTFTGTLDSDYKIALPDTFLRELPNRVTLGELVLSKGDYATLNSINEIGNNLSATCYAIHDGFLYVFGGDGEVLVHYVKKPYDITKSDFSGSDLEIPTEWHSDLLLYLEAAWARQSGNVALWMQLMDEFDKKANAAGVKFAYRVDGLPVTRGGALG